MNIIGFVKRIPKAARIAGIAVLSAAALALIGFGIWYWFFPVRMQGIDVSHFQGDISWRSIRESGDVKFAYLKATEGKSFTDPNFQKNWENATKYKIPVGAYHYYSASSDGKDQAAYFIQAVPRQKGMLPPAIDIEIQVTEQPDFDTHLADFVKAVTEHYGQKPVFYVPTNVYNVLYDQYVGYHYWIIDVDSQPEIKGWTFWQYSQKGKIASINGKVDLDIYRGSRWDFKGVLVK